MKKKDAFLLFLAVGIIVGYTYGLDIPQTLEIPLRKQPYNLTTTQFNLMYFSTFVLIGPSQIPLGILVDRYPVKKTLIGLLICLLLAQITISIMFQYIPQGYIPIVMIMRSIFGLAGQGLFTVQCIIMSLYAGDSYEFLAGLGLALPFTFDAFNSVISTAVYDATQNVPLVWYIGGGVCFVSLFFGFWVNKSVIREDEEQKNNTQGQQSYMRQIRLLSSKFWVIVACVFFVEASLGSFNDNLNEYIVSRFGFAYTDAGKLLLIPFLSLAIFTGIVGILLQRNPTFRRKCILFSTTLYMLMHFSLLLLPNSKQPQFYHFLTVILFLFSMSLNFAVYFASITTCVPFLVHQNVIGTAWGITGSAIGLSQCLIPFLNAAIIQSNRDLAISYRNLSICGLAFAMVPVGIALWIYYSSNYDILDKHYCQVLQNRKKDSLEKTLPDDKSTLEESLISIQSDEQKSEQIRL